MSASRMSFRAEGARNTRNLPPVSGTLAFATYGDGRLPGYVIDHLIKAVHRFKLHTSTAIYLVQSLSDGAAQPFQPGLFFLLPALHQPQGFSILPELAKIANQPGSEQQ
jgi:hypothetical protein